MMKQIKRIIMIFGFLIASTIVMHSIKAPQRIPVKGFRVACMPLTAATTENADKHLSPYAQIAHTTGDQRCYFRFAPQDIVCIPKSVAARQQKTKACPQFPTIDGTPEKFCYLLNKDFVRLSEELKKTPPVSTDVYITNKNALVKTWQDVRDILLGTK